MPADLRSELVARLGAAGCVAAEEEADELLRHAPDRATALAWVARREDGEPLAWITGTTRFAGVEVVVAPGVYVPRPQTEELVARAAALLPVAGRALDLCTGSGAIAAALAAAVSGSWVVGVDVSPVAAACARRNGVDVLVGDLAAPLRAAASFDVVTVVAPYVPTDAMRLLPADVRRHEPVLALDGGSDGLALVRRALHAASTVLRPDGHLVVEVGGDQHVALEADLAAAGFVDVTPWHDEDGDLRGFTARRGRRPRTRDHR